MTRATRRNRQDGDPLRICLLSSDYAVDREAGGGGGIETYVRLLARGMAAAGHDVHVIAPASRRTHTVRDGRVHVHAIHLPDEWPESAADLGEARSALSFAWGARRKLHALAATGGPFDVVEAPEYKGQGVFIADSEAPVVVKCHAHLLLCLELNGIDLRTDTALLADLEREALQKARAVHANSRALAARCASDYGLDAERIAHAPYGIDTTTFRPTVSRLRHAFDLTDARVLLFVGRMEARKGIATLVPAFAEIARSRPDVVLLLAGADSSGPPGPVNNMAWMRAEWERLGVSAERYRFLGGIPNEALPALYSIADLMVAPSAFEAFGLVYLESMACECPPVGCRAGGVPEVIADGETGALVPPGDAAALAARVCDLLESPAIRSDMASAGRARVEHEFSLDAMVRRTERLYREVAA